MLSGVLLSCWSRIWPGGRWNARTIAPMRPKRPSMRSAALTPLLTTCVTGLLMSSCATSKSAACAVYDRYSLAAIPTPADTSETVSGFAVLDAAMVEACR